MSGDLVVGVVASGIAGLSLVAAIVAIEVGRRATLRAVAEQRRARIDASAPRVVVRTLLPDWPPSVPGPSAGMLVNLNPRYAYDLPGNAEQDILLVFEAEVVNEGTTSGFVVL